MNSALTRLNSFRPDTIPPLLLRHHSSTTDSTAMLSLPTELLTIVVKPLDLHDFRSLTQVSKEYRNVFSAMKEKFLEACWAEGVLSNEEKEKILVSHHYGRAVLKHSIQWDMKITRVVLHGDRAACLETRSGRIHVVDVRTGHATLYRCDGILDDVLLTDEIVVGVCGFPPGSAYIWKREEMEKVELKKGTVAIAAHKSEIAVLIEQEYLLNGIWLYDGEWRQNIADDRDAFEEIEDEETTCHALIYDKEWIVISVQFDWVRITRSTGMVTKFHEYFGDFDEGIHVRQIDNERFDLSSDDEHYVFAEDIEDIEYIDLDVPWRCTRYRSDGDGITAVRAGFSNNEIDVTGIRDFYEGNMEVASYKGDRYTDTAVNDKWLVRIDRWNEKVLISVYSFI